MDSFAVMAVVIGVLALVLLGYFALLWTKDKGRSDEEAGDAARMDTGASTTQRTNGPA